MFTRDPNPQPHLRPLPAPAPASSTRESRPATFRHTHLCLPAILTRTHTCDLYPHPHPRPLPASRDPRHLDILSFWKRASCNFSALMKDVQQPWRVQRNEHFYSMHVFIVERRLAFLFQLSH